MWGDSNWKLKDLVNSTPNYITQRIPLKSRYVFRYVGKSSSLYEQNNK